MAQSFTATEAGALARMVDGARRRVLVTGAAGRIGSYFAEHARDKYELRLMVRGDEDGMDRIRPFGEVVEADLSDLDRLKAIFQGVDTVVHMAGDAAPNALWKDLLDANVIGTYNVFAAAVASGVRRVIHASSIHAVSGYPVDVQVKTSDPVNPGDLYGVSKCFGEALARYVAGQEGVSAITLRIGYFQPVEAVQDPKGLEMLDAFVSQRDLDQLINRCIDVENVQFAILHGLSDNRFKRLDISDARELVGYTPVDDSTRENVALRDLHLRDAISSNSAMADGAASGLRADVVPV